MKDLTIRFWASTKWWWLVLCAGILMIICGFAYWLWPVQGYAIASQIFGWLLILLGVVQLCIGAGPNTSRGRGWWIAGGIIEMFIGFIMVRSILISEFIFPYFLGMLFIYWGIVYIVSSVNSGNRFWWLYLVCGLLTMVIGFFFLEAGWLQDMTMTSFITSIAFIYWGFLLCMTSYDMKPIPENV